MTLHLHSLFYGAIGMLAVVTFAPPRLAAKPSAWLRAAVERAKQALQRPKE